MAKIRDILESRNRNLEVVGRIKSKKNFILANRKLAKAVLEDETGTIVLNLWGEQIDQCQVGDLVKVKKAYVRHFKGVPELNTWENIEILERANRKSRPEHV